VGAGGIAHLTGMLENSACGTPTFISSAKAAGKMRSRSLRSVQGSKLSESNNPNLKADTRAYKRSQRTRVRSVSP
jgi:hypothetical protein